MSATQASKGHVERRICTGEVTSRSWRAHLPTHGSRRGRQLSSRYVVGSRNYLLRVRDRTAAGVYRIPHALDMVAYARFALGRTVGDCHEQLPPVSTSGGSGLWALSAGDAWGVPLPPMSTQYVRTGFVPA